MEKAPTIISYPAPYTQMCPYEQRTGNCLAKDMCRFRHALNINAVEFDPSKKSREPRPTPPPAPVYYPPQVMPQEEVEEELDEFDPMEYFEEFKDCECCHGHVYGCSGEVCQDLGMCRCKVTAEMEAGGDFY